MSETPNTHRVATTLAAALREFADDAIPGCALESVVLHGTYTDGRGGYVGNLRRTFGPDDLQALLDERTHLAEDNAELRRQLADTPTSEAAVAKLREWVPGYEVGATHVAMPVATARKLLGVVDRAGLLEQRHDAIWDMVLELRQKATARGRDPYQDPTAQALAAILTGCASGGWQITYGSLVESRDDLDAAKARSVDLWERTKFEAEEHAHDWEERPGGELALIAWDEEQWFYCGPVIRPLTDGPEPQIEGQGALPVETAGSAPRGFRVGDMVQITGRRDEGGTPVALRLLGAAGYVTELDPGAEYPIGLAVEGFVGLVWCNSGEIRHADASQVAPVETAGSAT